jgi:hypothetical protein
MLRGSISQLQYILPRLRSVLPIALFSLVLFGSANLAFGEKIDNSSPGCVDVIILFARGSSQNKTQVSLDDPFSDGFRREEPEAGVFFQSFKSHLDREYPKVEYKAHSVHDFPNIGNNAGYRAVAAFSPPYANVLEAELGWLAAGDYRSSVRSGADETAWFIKDQLQKCPDQKIVLGGYSQGAQVAGDSLFLLTQEERENIGGVALFGDPKFLASDYSLRHPFRKTTTYPWKRGTATDRDAGMLDSRSPYVPADMSRKVFSWCFKDDFICTGYSGMRFGTDFINTLGAGHTRYAGFGVQQAATEIIQNMAPQLYAMDKNRGGVSKEKGLEQPVPFRPNSKPIDFMFLVNYSAGHDDVLGTLRHATPQVLPIFGGYFGGINYAVGDFGETGFNSHIPRINLRQDFKPLQRTLNPSQQIQNIFVRQLAFGAPSGGGGDVPEPHILAIERMAMEPTWRDEARKHMVLISDRPIKDPYIYNMCNSDVRIGFGLMYNRCTTDPAVEVGLTKYHSEFCKEAAEVLMSESCSLGLTVPKATHNVSRTLKDAIRIANSRNIAVSIVVPHDYPNGIDKEATEKQLQNLAKSTGGLFIKYDVFSQANYSDMVWRILNHSPATLRMSNFDIIDTKDQWGSTAPQPKGTIYVRENLPTTLDVSQSAQTFDAYQWDFDSDGQWDEQTDAPNVEHTFGMNSSGQFVTVMGQNEGGQSATSSFPVAVQPYDGPDYTEYTVPEKPTNAKAVLRDNQLEISWANSAQNEVMFVGEAEMGIPVVSTPAANGAVTIPYDEALGDKVLLWIINEAASSERVTVAIEQYIPEVVNMEVPKEKLGLRESNPWGQLVERTESALQPAVTPTPPATNTPEATLINQQYPGPQVAAATTLADLANGDEEAANDSPQPELADRKYKYTTTYYFGGIGLAALFILGAIIILKP